MRSFASRIAPVIVLVAAWLAALTLPATAQSAQSPAERNFNQGETYFKANNWTAAIPFYKAAVAADPTYAAAYYGLGLAYYQSKDPKNAAAAFKMYLKYQPNYVPGLVLLGISLRDAGDNAGAIDAFHAAIDLKPEGKYLNSAYYNMGVAYENAHQLPEAMQTYIVLRSISPTDAQDLLDYMRSVDPDLKAANAAPATPVKTAATPASGPATTARPASPPVAPPAQSAPNKSTSSSAADYFAQGKARFDKNDYSQAAALLQKAISLDPNLTDAYISLSESQMMLKDYEHARAAALKYQALAPTNPYGFMMEAFADRQLNRNADAIKALNIAIPLKPDPAVNLPSCYYELGMNYYRLGKTQEQEQIYQKLKTVNAKWAQDLYDATHESDDATPASPSQPKPALASAKSGVLPQLPDLPIARTAIMSASIIHAEDLTLNDVIFILQFRDYSTSNQSAADKVWSEVLDKQKDGAPIQISNAVVISSTKTTVDLALSDDDKHSKTADTHLILEKPLAAPARAGLVTNISGMFTTYKSNPIMLTMAHGALLSANTAASAAPSPSMSAQTTGPKPVAPASGPAPASSKPGMPGENWFTYKSVGGNFSALLPVEPKETLNPVPEEISNSRTILSLSNGLGYMVVYAQTATEHRVDVASFNAYRDSFLKTMPTCSVAAESDASPALRGYIGHAYRLNCVINGDKMIMVGDLYWGRRYGYAVLAMFNTAVSDPVNARRFLDSFSILDPSK